MGLGISKPRPKYTPPKICKSHQSGTTVLIPDFQFCTDLPGTMYSHIIFPFEVGGYTSNRLGILVLGQDPAQPCLFYRYNFLLPPWHIDISAQFDFAMTQIQLFAGYTNITVGRTFTYGGLAPVKQTKARIVTAWPLTPSLPGVAVNNAAITLTF